MNLKRTIKMEKNQAPEDERRMGLVEASLLALPSSVSRCVFVLLSRFLLPCKTRAHVGSHLKQREKDDKDRDNNVSCDFNQIKRFCLLYIMK